MTLESLKAENEKLKTELEALRRKLSLGQVVYSEPDSMSWWTQRNPTDTLKGIVIDIHADDPVAREALEKINE